MNKVDVEIEEYINKLKKRFLLIDPSKYYLAYSGGKDSHFLYWFIKEVLKDNKIEIVSVNTLMEHQEILERINKNADRVLLPSLKPMEIKEKYRYSLF
jgi:tRNA(Ile)-lysidine synthase TilS/MesJ